MTIELRDHFAGIAAGVFLTENFYAWENDALAKKAYDFADAMMAARGEVKASGRIKWNGGNCPVSSETKVRVWLEDGATFQGKAITWTWRHGEGINKIIAYQVL